MSDKPQEPLNGQQMQALQKQYHEALMGIGRDIELRKYAIDQAFRLASASNGARDGVVTYHDPVALAKAIHDFITLPAAEVKVTISG